ncbi:hypothetical protein [Chryseobacterium limigenitum]|uniref:Uncharacterized protein n=1 Tax=Chryseobacterium limigenitum TaxID=1612149 RepID=A0A1K2ISA7_9FLAO|nr:hypothetical protein [Chryseobacterium limigenitum]SFZ95138.1 hypothetical protein SAMN05216324_108164 [Chryseobacterium limigenitum]
MKDFILEDYDLNISGGDFEIGESDSQTVEFVLMSKQGEWKQYPETGCDIAKAQFGSINVLLDRNIRVQMQADGFNIEKLKITETGIEINGKYS